MLGLKQTRNQRSVICVRGSDRETRFILCIYVLPVQFLDVLFNVSSMKFRSTKRNLCSEGTTLPYLKPYELHVSVLPNAVSGINI